jgi:dATP pyrophosphohydrolase
MNERQFKRPESILIVIHTRTDQVLVMRRRRPPDFWQSVTGSLEWHEDPDQAARRELYEETGLEAGDDLRGTGETNRFAILPAWRSRYAPGVQHNVEHVYELLLDHPRPIALDPAEHTEYCWLSREEAIERVSSSTNRAAIAVLAR